MSVFKILVYGFVLVLITFVILTLVQGKFLGKTAGATEDVFNFTAPTLGLEEIPQGAVEFLSIEEYKSLNDTITKMLKSEKKGCFAKFNGFTQLEKEGKSESIQYVYDKISKKTSVRLTNRYKQLYDKEEFDKLKLCVIAGKLDVQDASIVADNFFKRYDIEEYKSSSRDEFDDRLLYLPVEQIIITSKDEKNIIILDGKIKINTKDNFNSNGYLYKTKKGEICFFPTHNDIAGWGKEAGIDEGWFVNTDGHSLSRSLSIHGLWC